MSAPESTDREARASTARSRAREHHEPVSFPQGLPSSALPNPGGPRPLTPIGPDRLRALREAIQSGRYPDDARVEEALARMFLRSVTPDAAGPDAVGPDADEAK